MSTKTSPKQYTDPELREKLKEQIKAGDKGGRPGQWSARKSQLLAHEYEAQGGGYTGPKTEGQKSLEKWTEEKWTTANGDKAIQGGETHRYLPEKAWEELSPNEKKSTDRKKVQASRKGEQFAANTDTAKKARKKATSPATTKKAPKKAATSATTKKTPAARKRTPAAKAS